MVRQLVTREDYFEAAMKILATEGAGALKIGALCASINVTSGSFYGYFGSFDGFVVEFLAFWEAQQTQRVVELASAPDDPAERIRLMNELGKTVPHVAEAAIRSWAHTHPIVAEAQKRVDDRRIKALTEVVRPACASAAEARRLGTMAVTLMVGLQQLRNPVRPRDWDLLFDEFEAVVMARYAENHGL